MRTGAIVKNSGIL